MVVPLSNTESNVRSLLYLFVWIQFFVEVLLRAKNHAFLTANNAVPLRIQARFSRVLFDTARTLKQRENIAKLIVSLYQTLLKTYLIAHGVYFAWNLSSWTLMYWSGVKDPTTFFCVLALCIFFLNVVCPLQKLRRSLDYDARIRVIKTDDDGSFYGTVLMNLFALAIIQMMYFVVPLFTFLLYIHFVRYSPNGEISIANGQVVISSVYIITGVITTCCIITWMLITKQTDSEPKPLPPGSLRERILQITSRIGFPIEKVMTRSTLPERSDSRPYISISIPKRELFSTNPTVLMLDSAYNNNSGNGVIFTSEEMIGSLCHELGHWYFAHAITMNIYRAVGTFFLVAINLYLAVKPYVYTSLGFPEGDGSYICGLVIVAAFYLPICISVFRSILNFVGRMNEFQADNFAVQLGMSQGLVNALINEHIALKEFPLSDPLYAAFFESEPDLMSRIRAIEMPSEAVS